MVLISRKHYGDDFFIEFDDFDAAVLDCSSRSANVESSFESFSPGIFTDFEETILFFATDADDFDDDCNQLQLWIWC